MKPSLIGRYNLALPVLLIASAMSLLAQTERGAIRGTVADPSGAAVPEARITAIRKFAFFFSSGVMVSARRPRSSSRQR